MINPTTLCPLCGQRNGCAQADSQTPVTHCWCFDAPLERSVLERLPAAQRNRACLCPRCAQGLPPNAATDTDTDTD
ncbi:cysteine-rich CWC family protein [Pseudomonas benzenivorans]|uniref:Cysteine-rich CWC family protein n=1 Tax=Pseudomonas benzenivorans TaxID=556533 RepID=A0ABY5H6R7_9PSED|nr:cysteine-rich CWC family protein [Pseudomonas benzenivorans]UTW07010.1 cysteine-rich CWC family protein [Pseudomonas benzenivorans]